MFTVQSRLNIALTRCRRVNFDV